MLHSRVSNKLKRAFCYSLTATLTVGFSFGSISLNVQAEENSAARYNKYGYRYSYESGVLNESQMELYDQLVMLCDRYLTTDTDVREVEGCGFLLDMLRVEGYNSNNAGDVNDLTMLLAVFERENPQYYFVDSSTYYYAEDSDTGDITGIYLQVYPRFVYGEVRSTWSDIIFSRIDECGEKINDYVEQNYSDESITSYIKEDIANDLVCEMTTYDLDSEYHQSIYSVFECKRSVCNGYALATSAILNSIGVKTVAPISDTHCWIKTKLDDGSWYATDPTWNDAGSVSSDKYLDLSDENIAAKDAGTRVHIIARPEFYPRATNDYVRPVISNDEKETNVETDSGKAKVVEGSDSQDTTQAAKNNSSARDNGSKSNNGSKNGNGSKSNNSSKSGNGSNKGNSSKSSSTANQDNPKNSVTEQDDIVVPEPVAIPDTVTSDSSKEVTSAPEVTAQTSIATPNGTSASAANDTTSATDAASQPAFCNEWRDGRWYSADGTQSYSATIGWYKNASGWWMMDSSGWYPTSIWQKVDGSYYYFNKDGYMAANEWVDGYYISGDGTWTYAPVGSWESDSRGWYFGDESGWYVVNSWQKIDGDWYYFDGQGYMVTNKYIDGCWIGADGVSR
ncbi:MAG: hypothetical protein ILA13_02865 [Eubacterium sp.]|nr:hypothetical protein [Eubacterium sp.]